MDELLSKFFIDELRRRRSFWFQGPTRTREAGPNHHGWDLLVVDRGAPDQPEPAGRLSPTYAASVRPRALGGGQRSPAPFGDADDIGITRIAPGPPAPARSRPLSVGKGRTSSPRGTSAAAPWPSSIFTPGRPVLGVFYLASSIEEIREILRDSTPFERSAARVLELVDENGDLRAGVAESELAVRVEELRAHLSETCRLHRRVIRNRRANVLTDDPDAEFAGYEVRGRRAPSC